MTEITMTMTERTVVPLHLLDALAACAPEPPAPAQAGRSGGAFDLTAWITGHGLGMDEPRRWQGGMKWVGNCPWNADHSDRSFFIIQRPDGKVGAGCQHNGCRGNKWPELRDLLEPDWRQQRTQWEQRQQERAAPSRESQFDSSLKSLSRDESIIAPSTAAQAARLLAFLPITEAVAGTPVVPDWRWRGYAAAGAVSGLVSRPKDGKTTLLFGLFRAWEKGEPFLGLETETTKVVYLAEERGATLREKVERWGIGEHVHVLMRHEAQGVPWDEVVRQAALHAIHIGAQALVVDTFAAWAGLAGDAENSAGAVLQAAEPLQWAASKGLSVLIPIHRRKSGGEHGEGIRGSSALAGALDIIIELERPRGDSDDASTSRVLRTVSRFEDSPPELVLRLTAAGYEACGDVPQARAHGERERIRQALTVGDSHTAEELGMRLSMPKATAHKRLAELEAKGHALRSGEGKKNDPYRWRAADGLADDGAPHPASVPEMLSSQPKSFSDESNCDARPTAIEEGEL